jgi:hypothetical protein
MLEIRELVNRRHGAGDVGCSWGGRAVMAAGARQRSERRAVGKRAILAGDGEAFGNPDNGCRMRVQLSIHSVSVLYAGDGDRA